MSSCALLPWLISTFIFRKPGSCWSRATGFSGFRESPPNFPKQRRGSPCQEPSSRKKASYSYSVVSVGMYDVTSKKTTNNKNQRRRQTSATDAATCSMELVSLAKKKLTWIWQSALEAKHSQAVPLCKVDVGQHHSACWVLVVERARSTRESQMRGFQVATILLGFNHANDRSFSKASIPRDSSGASGNFKGQLPGPCTRNDFHALRFRWRSPLRWPDSMH